MIEAGDRLRWWRASGRNQVQLKGDGTPVGSADLEVDELMRRELPAIAHAQLVTEESWPGSGRARRELSFPIERYWLVDPLDGTKNFIEGHDDYSIIVALVRNGAPVLGAVAHPERRELFLAERGRGAFVLHGGEQSIPVALPRINAHSGGPVRMVVPRYRTNGGMAATDALGAALGVGPDETLGIGSAMKSTTLARGQCDIVASFEGVQLWDLGGTSALLTEVGGEIRRWNGAPISFDLAELLAHDRPIDRYTGYLAATPGLLDRAVESINQRGLLTRSP